MKPSVRLARARTVVCVPLAVAVALIVSACGSSSSKTSNAAGSATAVISTTTTPSGGGSPKLILFELSFPCGLNTYATALCAGVTHEAKVLAPKYNVQIKTGVNFTDTTAFNSLIQNSEQLSPSALIVFPPGPATETPTLNQACARGIKVVIIDSPATGVKCQLSFIGAPDLKMGAQDAQWLIAHPPSSGSKEVGIVTFPPGQTPSMDMRTKGFEQALAAGGYKVVSKVYTSNALSATRTQVTNMLTAHPNLGAVFSANGPTGDGTAQALKNNHAVVQLSLDGFLTDIPLIKSGTISADTAQDPFRMGVLSVQYAANAIEGQSVPTLTYTPTQVVDKSNVDAYSQAGGLR